MSARPQPWVSAILQAMAYQIQQHALEQPEQWAVRPATIAVGAKASHLDASRPVLVLGCVSVSDLTNQTAGATVDAEAEVEIYCSTENPADPEGALHDLAADVRRAVMSDPQLGGALESGYVEPAGYAGAVDLDESSGMAALAIRFRVFYEWRAEDP